jgi:hypothetical protein
MSSSAYLHAQHLVEELSLPERSLNVPHCCCRKEEFMVQLQITTDQREALPLIQSAIGSKIKRIELGLRQTEQVIQRFERKYRISSEQFIDSYTAEDLEGGDDEYISWMGELKLRDAIREELDILQQIEYVPQGLSR